MCTTLLDCCDEYDPSYQLLSNDERCQGCPNKINDKQAFNKYIIESRDEFVRKFYEFFPVRSEAIKEAVWAENILLAFDQLKNKINA